MTDNEKLADTLQKLGEIAMGTSKATMFLGHSRDQFSRVMQAAARIIREKSPAPFQCECPGCGKKITVAYVNGQRRVKWDA